MLNPPLFFRQHELAADVDERTVKRAYAKSLKKIDQEIDLEGFQALRESYEHALGWLKVRDRLNASVAARQQMEEDSAADPGRDTPVDGNPVPDDVKTEAAAEVKKEEPEPETVNLSGRQIQPREPVDQGSEPEFLVAASTGQGKQVQQQEIQPIPAEIANRIFDDMLMLMRSRADEPDFAADCLRQTLDDERMYHMEARHVFEQMLAAHLANGWCTGNGELFDAAFVCFGWDKDRRRMLSLGHAGYLLERAYAEMTVFKSKKSSLRRKQWELLLKLRTERFPGDDYLKAHYKKLLLLTEQYPNWVWMVSSKENFESWTNSAQAWMKQDAQDTATVSAGPQTGMSKWRQPSFKTSNYDPEKWVISPWAVVILLVAIFRFVLHEVNETNTYKPMINSVMQVPQTNAEKYNAALGAINKANAAPGTVRQALYTLEQLADGGYADASYQLAWMYRNGNRIKPDAAEARKWFVLAAQQGNVNAKVMAGDYYFEGLGGKKDLAEAMRWYTKATEQGQSLAQIKLAHMYAKGLAVKKDTKHALDLIVSSAEKGQPLAQSELGLIRLNGTYGSYKSEEKAAYWFMQSARSNDVTGQRMFGLVNEKGLGGYQVDLRAAAEWYGKAAMQGDKEATKSLKNLCQSWSYPECRYLLNDVDSSGRST